MNTYNLMHKVNKNRHKSAIQRHKKLSFTQQHQTVTSEHMRCPNRHLESKSIRPLLLTGIWAAQAWAGPWLCHLAAQTAAEEDRTFKALLFALLPLPYYRQLGHSYSGLVDFQVFWDKPQAFVQTLNSLNNMNKQASSMDDFSLSANSNISSPGIPLTLFLLRSVLTVVKSLGCVRH